MSELIPSFTPGTVDPSTRAPTSPRRRDRTSDSAARPQAGSPRTPTMASSSSPSAAAGLPPDIPDSSLSHENNTSPSSCLRKTRGGSPSTGSSQSKSPHNGLANTLSPLPTGRVSTPGNISNSSPPSGPMPRAPPSLPPQTVDILAPTMSPLPMPSKETHRPSEEIKAKHHTRHEEIRAMVENQKPSLDKEDELTGTMSLGVASANALLDSQSDNVLGKRKESPVEEETSTSEAEEAHRQKIAKVTPSTSSPPASQAPETNPSPPTQITCGHKIHPAYAATYADPLCPYCCMQACIEDVRLPQEVIMARGGTRAWREALWNAGKPSINYTRVVKGGSGPNKPLPSALDGDGIDFSYRHAKKRITNLVAELEELSVREKAWELEQPAENLDSAKEPVHERRKYSATNALAWYKGTMATGVISQVDQDCILSSRKRGRDMEVSTDPDYPESDDEREDKETHRWFKTTSAQRKFIEESKVPTIEEADALVRDHEGPPKRKRLRTDARVSFNEEVYVRADNDVDILRKLTSSPSMGYLEGTSAIAVPGPSILRTAPLKVNPKPRNPKPKAAHKVIALKDGKSRSQRWYHHSGSRFYQPGEWAPAKGYDIFDTSGSTYDHPIDWALHVAGLQDEATKWDEMDIAEEESEDLEEEYTETYQEKLKDLIGDDVAFHDGIMEDEGTYVDQSTQTDEVPIEEEVAPASAPSLHGAMGAFNTGGVAASVLARALRLI